MVTLFRIFTLIHYSEKEVQGMCNVILNTEEGLYTQNVYFFKTFDTF